MFLSVVIATRQAVDRLPRLIRGLNALRDTLPYRFEALLVDDGSTDGTAEAAASAGLSVLRQDRAGYGAALRTGMLAARGRYRMQIREDWAMNAEQALMLLPPALVGADVALASRHAMGATLAGVPPPWRWASRVWAHLLRNTVLPGISDAYSGFRVFHADAARAVFGRARENGAAAAIETLVLARRLSLRIADVPVDWTFSGPPWRLPFPDPSLLQALFRLRPGLEGASDDAPPPPPTRPHPPPHIQA